MKIEYLLRAIIYSRKHFKCWAKQSLCERSLPAEKTKNLRKNAVSGRGLSQHATVTSLCTARNAWVTADVSSPTQQEVSNYLMSQTFKIDEKKFIF